MKSKILLLISLFFSTQVLSIDQPHIYIMLNIDLTIVDRINDCNSEVAEELKNKNFKVQLLDFIATKETSAWFIPLYDKLSHKREVPGESKYMQNVEVTKFNYDKFKIYECVVIRPTTQYLLERLKKLNIPTTILITSRNDDARTRNLQQHLDLFVKNDKFTKISTFVPRNYFRINVDNDGKKLSLKSMTLLRNNLSYIRPKDYVIAIDYLSSNRFIKSDSKRDQNIYFSEFKIAEGYAYNKDKLEVDSVIEQINNFIQN